jgi:hypothetical protein
MKILIEIMVDKILLIVTIYQLSDKCIVCLEDHVQAKEGRFKETVKIIIQGQYEYHI